MTLRKIVSDIRTHAADFLNEVGLSPVVKLADGDAVSDLIVFQTKGGREHVVVVAVPFDAGEDAWDRAAVAPVAIRWDDIPATDWRLLRADGVALDDIAGFKKFETDAERVVLIVDHIISQGDTYIPRDDMGERVCTDARISQVVDKLVKVADLAGGDYSISISGQENAAGEDLVDSVSLAMFDGRYIDVVLRRHDIQIGIETKSLSSDLTISGIEVFDRAMDELAATFAERSSDNGY